MSQKQSKDTALRSYWRFCRQYKWRMGGILLLFLTAETVLAFIPIFIGQLVDTLTTDSASQWVWIYVALLVGFNSAHDIIGRIAELFHRAKTLEVPFLYENHLFKRTLGHPYHYFVNNASGKIASYVQLLRNELHQLIFRAYYKYSGIVVGIVSSTLILGSINIQTALIFVAGIVSMLVVGKYTLKQDMKHQAKEADAHSTKNSVIFDSLANFPTVKAIHAEVAESKRLVGQQRTALAASKDAFKWGLIFWTSMAFFVRHLMWPAIIILNVHLFIQGETTIGQLATIFSIIIIFSNNIWMAVWLISDFGNTKARIDEAYAYLSNVSIPQTPQAKKIAFTASVDLKDITFAYPDAPEKNTLNNFSLSLEKGENIGIVGASGSGKSTLAKLLLGLYDIDKKHSSVDSKPATLQDISKLISFVPQDTSLFSRSIIDNIRYGKPKATKQEAITAAKKAHAWEFIKNLPDGIDTLVGERGVKLSGGQRQRIAIARAILHDQPILLLDEATSALDSQSEVAIQKAIDALASSKTVIAIAHRLSTLQKMDRIIVMDSGKIVEDGSHDELLERGGRYASLWQHQSGGFICKDIEKQ